MWLAHFALGLFMLLFVMFVVGMTLATVMDWYDNRKNKLWNELQRDHTKRSRPAAK